MDKTEDETITEIKGDKMKKIFKFQDDKKNEDRVLDGIKNEIRKYVKREKKKSISDKSTMYWDFDCKIGASKESAKEVIYEDLIKELDKIKATNVDECYIEILAKEVQKPLKEEEVKSED